MAKGLRTGGRRVGTPNKRTLEAAERLAELDCDPLEGMAKIAMDKRTPLELRARMLAELVPYLYPKRKAVEHAVHNAPDGPAQFIIDLTADQEQEIAIRAVEEYKRSLAH